MPSPLCPLCGRFIGLFPFYEFYSALWEAVYRQAVCPGGRLDNLVVGIGLRDPSVCQISSNSWPLVVCAEFYTCIFQLLTQHFTAESNLEYGRTKYVNKARYEHIFTTVSKLKYGKIGTGHQICKQGGGSRWWVVAPCWTLSPASFRPVLCIVFVLHIFPLYLQCISISDFTCIAVPLVVLYWYLYKNQVSTVFVLIARFGPFPCPLGQENWPPALLATMATSLKYFLWKEEEGGLILASSTGGHLSKEFSVKEEEGGLILASCALQ